MNIQIIQDINKNTKGVFIPMEEWMIIKTNYPDIDKLGQEIPEWQKNILDIRLDAIEKTPNNIKPIEELFIELDND